MKIAVLLARISKTNSGVHIYHVHLSYSSICLLVLLSI